MTLFTGFPLGRFPLLRLSLTVGIPVIHVLRVRPRVREALAALVALVGLLPGVQARVLDQVMLVFKCFLANLTLVWSFSCEEGQEDTHGLQRQGWWLLRPSLPLHSLRCWSNTMPEPPRCLLFKGSSVAETKQKTPHLCYNLDFGCF